MLIGLMSDSHDNLPLIKVAVDFFNSRAVDKVLHAGDIISPFCANELDKLKCGFTAVFGNNDGEKKAWKQRVSGWGEIYENSYHAVIDGKRLLVIHDPHGIKQLVGSGKYDIIVHGHTHKIAKYMLDGVLVVNPGENGAWLTGRPTVALLSLPSMEVEFVDL